MNIKKYAHKTILPYSDFSGTQTDADGKNLPKLSPFQSRSPSLGNLDHQLAVDHGETFARLGQKVA